MICEIFSQNPIAAMIMIFAFMVHSFLLGYVIGKWAGGK
jgi:hypothetical protein